MKKLLMAMALVLGSMTFQACHTTYNVTAGTPQGDEAEARELHDAIAMPTVQVQCEHGWGSGVVFSHGQYVLTAAHVVMYEGQDPNTGAVLDLVDDSPVLFKNEGIIPYVSASKVVKIDKALDLAILKLEKGYPYASAVFSPVDPYLYQKCWASGHPHAVTDTTITEGRVQDLWDDGFIRYSSPTTFGNSGGPVFIRVDGQFMVSSTIQRVHVEAGAATTFLGLGCLPYKVREFVSGF